MKLKPVISRRSLALSTGQRIFLTGFGMQENGKVLANLPVAPIGHLGGRRAHDAPVPFPNRDAKLFVTNSATDEVHLHRPILAPGTQRIVMPRRCRTLLLIAFTLSQSACYYVQAARGQYDVLSRSEPIDEVLADLDACFPAVAGARLLRWQISAIFASLCESVKRRRPRTAPGRRHERAGRAASQHLALGLRVDERLQVAVGVDVDVAGAVALGVADLQAVVLLHLQAADEPDMELLLAPLPVVASVAIRSLRSPRMIDTSLSTAADGRRGSSPWTLRTILQL